VAVTAEFYAVYACVRIVGEGVAALPLKLYENLPRGRRVASEIGLHHLLHDEPDPEMSSFVFRDIAGHLCFGQRLRRNSAPCW
jgi:phage portal protein BeeE